MDGVLNDIRDDWALFQFCLRGKSRASICTVYVVCTLYK